MPQLENLERRRLPNNGNCTLSFNSADGGYVLHTKVRGFGHKWEVVATESHAREYRAMYPHQRSVGRFALTFDLNGYREFQQLMEFFRSYTSVIASQFDDRPASKPTMHVVMAVRGFSRDGVPVKGMSWGDHMGSMVFNPTVIFESAHDPQDPTILTQAQASRFVTGGESDARTFFYPASAASYNADVRPNTVYDFEPFQPIGGGAPRSSVQDAIDSVGGQGGRPN